MHSLRHFPLGTPFPDSPHAVTSSLPTLADVRGYEEKDPRVLHSMRSGYPRFVVNTYVRKWIDLLLMREGLIGRSAALVLHEQAAQDLLNHVGGAAVVVSVDDGLQLVHCDAEDAELVDRIWKYIQHVGCGVSSRQAEDLLVRFEHLAEAHIEAIFAGDAAIEVERHLAQLYNCGTSDLWVCASGMSAFYAGFRAVQAVQRRRKRTHWVQLGWLYLDSGCILKAFLSDGETLEYCYDVNETDQLIERLAALKKTLAGVVVECPTNPLVQVCDLKRVYAAVQANGGVLIVDPTVASVYNMNIMPYADVLVNSLTKYAAHEGDVMSGALALNAQSPHYQDLLAEVPEFHLPLYSRDLQRLAHEMQDAPKIVAQMNDNASHLAEYLRTHPAVGTVYYATASSHHGELAREAAGGGAMISIELVGSMERFYDTISVMKGPSFGTQFTLIAPFMYLAHYDLVTESKGRKFLRDVGIAPDLIRISVGAEPYEAIEATFAKALDACL